MTTKPSKTFERNSACHIERETHQVGMVEELDRRTGTSRDAKARCEPVLVARS
jgi:hypothetical protein